MRDLLIVDQDGAALRRYTRNLSSDFCVTRSPSMEDAQGLLAAGHAFDVVICNLATPGARDFCERLAQHDGLLVVLTNEPLAASDPLAAYAIVDGTIDKVRNALNRSIFKRWLTAC